MATTPTPTQTQLDYLRTRSLVDCDTHDVSIGRDLGPFVDCTSNQAIAYLEIQKPEYKSLLLECATLALSLTHKPPFLDATPAELTVEIIMVKLSLQLLPYITGRIHIQTNPLYAQSYDSTLSNARRIISLVHELSPSTPASRISVKIPATYSGLRACAVLEKEGICTLATMLFTMTQAAAAAVAGCTYIAPYVNALKVHFTPGFEDNTKVKGLKLCVVAQKYYQQYGYETQVLPASLTSVAEILQLAGAPHITVPPILLKALAAEPHNSVTFVNTSLFDVLVDVSIPNPKDFKSLLDDEEAFNKLLEAEDDGKIKQAIEILTLMHQGMITLAKEGLQVVASASASGVTDVTRT